MDKRNLFAFKAVATGAFFCVAVAGVANVDFAERAMLARAIVLAIGNGAADTLIYFAFHSFSPPFLLVVCTNPPFPIDILQKIL